MMTFTDEQVMALQIFREAAVGEVEFWREPMAGKVTDFCDGAIAECTTYLWSKRLLQLALRIDLQKHKNGWLEYVGHYYKITEAGIAALEAIGE